MYSHMDDYESIATIHAIYTDRGEIEARYMDSVCEDWRWISLDEYSRCGRLTRKSLIDYVEEATGIPVDSDAVVTIEWVDSIDE